MLEQIRLKRLAFEHRRGEVESERTAAEQALAALPDLRQQALRAQERGEEAEVPSGEGLQAAISLAVERLAAIKVEEQKLTEEAHEIVDRHLGYFEERDRQAQGEAGAALEQAAESIRASERKVRAAMAARGIVRLACIRAHLDPPPEMLPSDLLVGVLELEKARHTIARHESAIREHQEHRTATPRKSAHRDPLVSIEG